MIDHTGSPQVFCDLMEYNRHNNQPPTPTSLSLHFLSLKPPNSPLSPLQIDQNPHPPLPSPIHRLQHITPLRSVFINVGPEFGGFAGAGFSA